MKRVHLIIWLLPFACFGIGVGAAWTLESGRLRGWYPLGAPPGGAKEIFDADAGLIFVRDSQGALYRCPKCWEQTEPLEKPLIDPQRPCPGAEAAIPPAPGEVLDRLAGRECYADGATDFEYVILTDGSVWEWSHTRSAYGMLVYPIFAVAGCLAGSSLLALAWILTWLKRRQTARTAA